MNKFDGPVFLSHTINAESYDGFLRKEMFAKRRAPGNTTEYVGINTMAAPHINAPMCVNHPHVFFQFV